MKIYTKIKFKIHYFYCIPTDAISTYPVLLSESLKYLNKRRRVISWTHFRLVPAVRYLKLHRFVTD